MLKNNLLAIYVMVSSVHMYILYPTSKVTIEKQQD